MNGLAAGRAPPYLAAMSWFPKPSSPRAAIADLRAFMRQGSREQRLGATLAILTTIIIVVVFFVDSSINTAPPPRIVYVENWPTTRTDAEIKADQAKDQAKRDAAIKERQRQFQALENTLGM